MFIAVLERGSLLSPFQVVIDQPNAKIHHIFSKLEQLIQREINRFTISILIIIVKLKTPLLVILNAYVDNLEIRIFVITEQIIEKVPFKIEDIIKLQDNQVCPWVNCDISRGTT